MAKEKITPVRLSPGMEEKLDVLKEALIQPSRSSTIEYLIEKTFRDMKLNLDKK